MMDDASPLIAGEFNREAGGYMVNVGHGPYWSGPARFLVVELPCTTCLTFTKVLCAVVDLSFSRRPETDSIKYGDVFWRVN